MISDKLKWNSISAVLWIRICLFAVVLILLYCMFPWLMVISILVIFICALSVSVSVSLSLSIYLSIYHFNVVIKARSSLWVMQVSRLEFRFGSRETCQNWQACHARWCNQNFEPIKIWISRAERNEWKTMWRNKNFEGESYMKQFTAL